MAQRLRRLVAAVNGSNKAMEPYRGGADVAAGSQSPSMLRSAAHIPWYAA